MNTPDNLMNKEHNAENTGYAMEQNKKNSENMKMLEDCPNICMPGEAMKMGEKKDKY